MRVPSLLVTAEFSAAVCNPLDGAKPKPPEGDTAQFSGRISIRAKWRGRGVLDINWLLRR